MVRRWPGQKRNDGGGGAIMSGRKERVDSSGAYLFE